jgi:hypothetical protein
MSASNRDDLSQRVAAKDSSPGFIDRDDRAVTSTALLESPPSLSQQLFSAIEQGQAVRPLKADVAANDLWESSHPTLMESKPWLFQSGLESAKSQVMRIAHPLAVAAQSTAIRPEHLQAAMSYWEFTDPRDKLPQGPLAFDEDAHIVYWYDKKCLLETGNSQRIFKRLYGAYRLRGFVHRDVMENAFDDFGISTNRISQGVSRLRKELRRDSVGVVADAIQTYKQSVIGCYRIESNALATR